MLVEGFARGPAYNRCSTGTGVTCLGIPLTLGLPASPSVPCHPGCRPPLWGQLGALCVLRYHRQGSSCGHPSWGPGRLPVLQGPGVLGGEAALQPPGPPGPRTVPCLCPSLPARSLLGCTPEWWPPAPWSCPSPAPPSLSPRRLGARGRSPGTSEDGGTDTHAEVASSPERALSS